MVEKMKERLKDVHMKTNLRKSGIKIAGDVREVDITERKKAEESLRDAEEKAKSIFEKANDGIVYLSKFGEILDVNEKALEIFGGTKNELLGKHFTRLNIFSIKDIPTLLGNLKKIISGKDALMNTQIKNKKGREFFLECSASLIKKNGKISNIIAIIRDITERKQAEAVLKESEKKYRTLVENIPQKIFLKDRNSVYISCNENYAWDLKIKADEIAGKTDYEFYPKKLAEKYRADDKRVMKSGKIEDIEEEYIPDGEKTFVHTIKVPVKGERGNVIGMLGIFWDITEKRKAENEIQKGKEKWTSLTENTDDIIMIVDDKGVIQYINKTLGNYTPEKTVGTPIYNYVPKEQASTMMKHLEKVFKTSEADSYGISSNIPKVGTVWFNTKVVPIKNGKKIKDVIMISANVTKRRIIEENLKKSEEKFRNMVETTSDCIWEVDKNGVYTYVSPKIKDILGYEPEEIVGKPQFDFMPKDEVKKIVNFFKKIKKNRKPFASLENWNVHKNGTRVLLETSGVPLLDERGNLIGYRGIGRNITERKRMEEKIEHTTMGYLQQSEEIEKLKSLDKEKDEFLNLMTHELRTPLTSIIGMTEILLSKKLDGLTNEQSKSLNIVLDESMHLKKIINRILTVVRLEKGKIEIEMKPLDISNIIEATVKSLKSMADERDINIALEVPEKLPLVKADKGYVVEVLNNLIDNAIKFSPRKSEIIVSAGVKGKHVLIKVKDNGIGIDEKSKPHIFEKFYQSDMSISKMYGGTGLGLYACKLIIQKMKGDSGFTSSVGKGSTFYFSLPISKIKRGEV